jgi:hypothetical protein
VHPYRSASPRIDTSSTRASRRIASNSSTLDTNPALHAPAHPRTDNAAERVQVGPHETGWIPANVATRAT